MRFSVLLSYTLNLIMIIMESSKHSVIADFCFQMLSSVSVIDFLGSS